MRTLLRLDASARHRGSYSRDLADHFEAGWTRVHDGGRIVRRDLAIDPPPHLDQATVAAFGAGPGDSKATSLSDLLIAELEAADDLLISSPLYNFGLPSPLKAYIDHVVRSGRTFRSGDDGAVGLLEGKTACLVTARGGSVTPGVTDDFQVPHLRAILGYIGISEVSTVTLHSTVTRPEDLGARMTFARQQIDDILDGCGPEWIGAFSDDDRREIHALRAGQAEAIATGDAGRYAQLCASDVQLMIPGRDIVSGRDAFLACEEELLAGAPVTKFEKHPIRVERHGDLVVEIGRQRVAAEGAGEEAFRPAQKYTHVFRRTAQGWRFALLMSNSCQ